MSRLFPWLVAIIFLSSCNNNTESPDIDVKNAEFSYQCQENRILILGDEEENSFQIFYNNKKFDNFSEEPEFIKVLSSYDEYIFPPVATCDSYGARVVFLPKKPSRTRKMLGVYLMNDGIHEYTVAIEPL